MNISFKKILSWRPHAGKGSSERIHPNRDWVIGLCIALCIFVVGAVYATVAYHLSRQDPVEAASVSVDAVLYKREKIDQVLKAYAARKETFDALRGGFRGERFVPPPVAEGAPVRVE